MFMLQWRRLRRDINLLVPSKLTYNVSFPFSSFSSCCIYVPYLSPFQLLYLCSMIPIAFPVVVFMFHKYRLSSCCIYVTYHLSSCCIYVTYHLSSRCMFHSYRLPSFCSFMVVSFLSLCLFYPFLNSSIANKQYYFFNELRIFRQWNLKMI